MAHLFHSVVPLGQDGLLLQPIKRSLILVASAQSVVFDGWHQIESNGKRLLFGRSGERVRHYPEYVDFRVTASMRHESFNLGEPPYPTPCQAEPNEYLLGLRFRLKDFHELETKIFEPKLVRQVGVPAEVPYNERVFQVSFKLDNVPVEDRLVLEVLSPEGQRISKFHLEF